ncbi:hypothetical protein LPB86_16595 [Pedobacter sp. MC2016-14]|uniref:hypothetical protein n=1 Tax=Pedobacter sp. MC2016-14 TaxID=2897327 RepID=UPI001E2DE43A|nr:hypothetical protein [Pedobacter sp. MC2016-14]MCD0489865.1 hypothetical protein [Pedobacter sp. MC2016-14]
MKRMILGFSVLTVLILSACSPSTRITGSWVDPKTSGQITSSKTLFVASLTSNIEARTKLENSLAEKAVQRNLKVLKSIDFFSPEFYQKKPTKEQLLSKIQQTGADVILTMSMLRKESDKRYVPGAGPYMPFRNFGWYGGFYSYYNFWAPTFYDPGYYVVDKTYFMETNLYDTKTEKLIWSAQSETINPGSLNNFVQEYPKILLEQLAKDGLLQNTNVTK